MKQAVMAFISKNDLILTISRKNKPHKVGLIGGKVDQGETQVTALEREVLEEVGLKVTVLREVFSKVVDDFTVSTFLVDYDDSQILTPESGCTVQWLSVAEFLNQSEYRDYNLELLKTLGLKIS